ncbi:calponin homology domain-containing protein DDB_G0272472-like isoform X2 [Planococcus citri]|uniref:calponin homology domain-containing protein DDB_G0272472-like isoform X2 n=1 Tax=Planococcus citri TaxID=170843 RepID=UPI0031F73158
MGCIQSYFRKAAAGSSSQASPVDADRQIINFEPKSSITEPPPEKVPIVPQEELSPTNNDEEDPDDENAEKGSLHCVEATAVRTLAASTGTVAILGTTAKYNEKVDYRRSYQEDTPSNDEPKSENIPPENSQSEPELESKVQEQFNEEPADKSQIAQNGPTSIVTTAIIESRLSQSESELEKSQISEKIPAQSSVEKADDTSKPAVDSAESEKYLPKVVESIEKAKKESFDKKDATTNDDVQEPTPDQNNVNQEPVESLPSSEPKPVELIAELKKSPSPAAAEIEDRDTLELERTNGNSEIESTSSDIISVVNELREIPPKKDSFEETNKPNRLSFGQISMEESEQNTLEISSADDVMKNESTDLTSPESLRGLSFDESFPKMNILVEGKAESRDDGESSKEENAREISNTSLNTLGDDSEDDGSDLDFNFSRKTDHGMKRFDTISSNGESSYNRVEDHNYPSVTEEPDLEEVADEKLLDLDFTQEDNVFDNEELKRLKKTVRENVIPEVDDICKQAVEKTTDIMAKIAAETAIIVESKDTEEVNNVSESSVLSAVDSVVAEKGSDFDSLSFLDEQSDSRSVSVLGQDEAKLPKSEVPEAAAVTSPAADDAQKRLADCEQVSSETQEESLNSSQEISGAVITQEDISVETEKTAVDSVSEDLPKPPDLEEFPPLPENLDQFDVTEDELKSVQLPDYGDIVVSDTKTLPDPELAASKIQAGVRGYLTRKQFKNRTNSQDDTSEPTDQKSDTSLGKDYNVQKKRMSLDSKLGDFENIRKLPKLRCTLSECVEEESENTDLDKAASKIQATFRNYRARKSICLGENRKLLNGQSTIISKIIEDAEKPDNPPQPVNGKVETIQEKPIEEDQTPSSDKPISTEQMGSNRMAVKTFEDDPLKQAAVKIQATYRGFKTRKSIQISASAATKIQAHFRGYKVRKSIKRSSSLNDLRDSASSSTSNLSTQPDLEKKVAKIQAGVRGYLVRKRHSLQNSAAAKIQINYRKYKSRKESKTKDPEQ